MITIRILLKLIPWILSAVLIAVLFTILHSSGTFQSKEAQTIITQNTILQEVEQMGKLELIKYNFRDITELEKKGNRNDWFGFFNWGEDAKMALVSVGNATGCLDLQKITKNDVSVIDDTVYVKLPAPEICYYKLDMEKTHIYSLETGREVDKKTFIQEAYKLAEQRIRDTALEAGILEQTNQNAKLVLQPLLERLAGRPVIITFKMSEVNLPKKL